MSVVVVILHLFLYYTSFFVHLATPQNQNDHQYCATNSKCGSFENIPFPFYLDASCRTLSDNFSLSCINSSSLFLNIDSESYNVLHFFPDGVLVDFPPTNTMCRQYNDLRSFPFSGNQYFGISTENVLDLNDCDESSQSQLCKVDSICEETSFEGCDGRRRYPSCCYPLSAWRRPFGHSFSDFSQLFGCRGFSSWVNLRGSNIGKRGIKLEWAVPVNSTSCAANAHPLNATSVASGIRCQCSDGFLGDGFSVGLGCLKSCFKDGKELRGNDCYRNNHGRKKKIILAGVITSGGLIVVSLAALCVLKLGRVRSHKFGSDEAHSQSVASTQEARLFKYHELEEATKGFGELVDQGTGTSMYAGVVVIGGSHSRVAVQRVEYCETDQLIRVVLSRLERLSAITHRNMARIIGWSFDAIIPVPLLHVVYEYPENGTLKEHLRGDGDHENTRTPLDWCTRLKIAAETANVLAFLQHEISPPIFHHALQSGCIFLDMDFTVKLAGFEQSCRDDDDDDDCRKNNVYNLGVVLVEIITGGSITGSNISIRTALQKIKNGKLEEIVDPRLYYHEQPPFRREQIEIIADLATRCLLFGPDGKVGMADVARELIHMTKDTMMISTTNSSVDGRGSAPPILDETFSNSSLLQMISMSPDSIYLPKS